jgi:hypothetical protein
MLRHLATSFFIATSGSAFAQTAFELHGGTQGLGIGIVAKLSDRTNFRIGGNYLNTRITLRESDVEYRARQEWRNAPILFDWFPSATGSFRFTGGVIANGNRFSVESRPNSFGFLDLNNRTYSSSQVPSVTGTVKFNSAAPYLGVGWGNPVREGTNWGYLVDLGVAYQGRAKASLTATCGAVSAALCAQIIADANAEATQLQNELRGYRWIPFVQAAVTKRF